eukprot:scaffold5126_cov29-Attheya_sp.AAC.3
MIYVDDCILMSPDNQDIDDVIVLLQESVGGTRPFNSTGDEGDISDYLVGVKVEKLDDGTMTLTQPHLIDQIISDLGLKDNTKTKELPALSSRVLNKDVDGLPFKETGKINFLEKSTHPELAYASHHCARFSFDPKDSHAQAIKQIGRYLMGTRDKGIILKPNPDMGLEDWVNADFCGNWDRKYALEDPTTARSRSGYIVRYCGCPILWRSKLQTQVALSTTEAEYVALSQSLRELLPVMRLLNEAKAIGINILHTKPIIRCTVFEENKGTLELTNVPKMRARTKHINSKYHHFRDFVIRKIVSVLACDTSRQLGDGFTKSTSKEIFLRHRMEIMGW